MRRAPPEKLEGVIRSRGGVERGERNLTLQSVERIADRLDLEPLALLTPGSQ